MRKVLITLLCIGMLLARASIAAGQTTAFTYQGNLVASGIPANGDHDFEFALFDDVSGGSQLGMTLTRSPVAIANGLFSVSLDFGGQFPGANRFLEIRVRQTGGGAFTPLAPRQPVNSAPYSVRSLATGNADSATNATTATNALQLGGVAANQYVLTGDSRMSDARNPLPNSGNYVQNTTSPQSSSNFNISGIGAANILNATTQYNLGGSRLLGVSGTTELPNSNFFAGINAGTNNIPNGLNGVANSFVGSQAGQANTSGFSNSFFGTLAGQLTTTGSSNSFLGAAAGNFNTTGNSNSFFGQNSGFNNSTGSRNTFVGLAAGISNTTGSNNTAIGFQANVDAGPLTFATAIGSGSSVMTSNTLVLGRAADAVQVPGSMTVSGTLNATLPAGSGNYIQNSSSPQSSSNFNITGDGIAGGTLSGGVVNATTQFNIGGARVLASPGSGSIIVGAFAGVSGFNNTFVGGGAGRLTTGGNNSFFGLTAGDDNVSGSSNSFFGLGSGGGNVSGFNNAFFGNNAGLSNIGGSNNTAIGTDANVATNNLNFATAIGSGASVSSSNTVTLGRAADTVQVPGSMTTSGTLSGAIVNAAIQFNIDGGRVLGTAGSFNLFAGIGAGQSNSGDNNAFFGALAGNANTTGTANAFFGSGSGVVNTLGGANAFFGPGSGSLNTTGSSNAFFGTFAGNANTTGASNAFFGRSAGDFNTTGAGNTIIGENADVTANNLSNATAIGFRAAVSQSNSLVLGSINGVNGATADTNVGIGTAAPTNLLTIGTPEATLVNGSVGIFSPAGTNLIMRETTADVEGIMGVNSSSGVIYGSMTNHRVNVRTNNINRLVIDGSGNVGIGTSTPTTKLHVAGDGLVTGTLNGNIINATTQFNINGGESLTRARLDLLNSDPTPRGFSFEAASNGNLLVMEESGSTFVTVTQSGNVGIGDISPTSKLSVNGALDVSNVIHVGTLGTAGSTAVCRNGFGELSTCSSSSRYKSNIHYFGRGLGLVQSLRPVSFNWKQGGMPDLGLVAEDVAKIEPLLATTNANGETEGVKYDRVAVVLINAVKEQQAQIESLEQQIKAQQAEIDAFRILVCSQNPTAEVCRPRK